MQTIGIVGAGVSGRLLALELAHRGWTVTLFDRDGRDGRASCTWVGAGMLAPWCELMTRDVIVSELGERSLALWPEILARLPLPVDYRQLGSIVVAHANDRREFALLRRAVLAARPDDTAAVMQSIDGAALGELEPALAARFPEALYFPVEGQVDNRGLLLATAAAIEAHPAITWLSGTEVTTLAPYAVTVAGDTAPHRFDAVADCRGLGARGDVADLRGVRGELVYLEAPEVELQRPIRLMHPRYPIYIVPRADNIYVIGATQIESEDPGPATVRSTLELLSAAYTVHSGFAEARVLDLVVGRRPAYADNLPHLDHAPGLVRINGLYRHGFLISPAMVAAAADLLCGQPPTGPLWTEILRPLVANKAG